jgi:energy-coupling factor transport system substrate-specific component
MKVKSLLVAPSICFAFLGFTWPFFAPSEDSADKASWFFLTTIPIAILLIVALIAQEELGSKNIAFLGVLTALVAALRPLGIGAIGIEPMWFALILASRALGPTFGLLLGALSMTLSALLTGGVGPWLAYQVAAAAFIGWGVGVIPKNLRGKGEIAALVLYGALAAAFFGIAMDLQFWPWTLGQGTQLSYIAGTPLDINLKNFISYHFLSSMAWDIPRAILTATLIAIAGAPVLNALRRARAKSAFVEIEQLREFAKN